MNIRYPIYEGVYRILTMNRNHPFHDLLKPFGIRIDLHGKPVHDPCDQSVDKAHVLILLKVLSFNCLLRLIWRPSSTPVI